MTITIDPARLATFEAGALAHGSHDQFAGAAACSMEWAAWLADEPHSDRPACASPALASLVIGLNDRWDDEQRQTLKPYIPRLIGTRDGQDEARGYMALDWLIRTYTPTWLDLAGLTAEAAELRARRIVDMVAAKEAGPVVRAAQSKAAAARAAARAAAGAAAWAAAGDAAGAAAWAAAGAAAGAAARDAARDALKPTVEILQASALELLDRMIDPSAAQEAVSA